MKLHRGLRQRARQLALTSEDADRVCEQVIRLNELNTLSNAMKYRIGASLLSGGKIIAPACPDYSHSNGRYTFDSVGDGVSLLTSLHIDFLHQVAEILPDCPIVILLADHEANDEALCEATGCTSAEFAQLISRSVANTAQAVELYGWQSIAMTAMIPDLVRQELINIELINSNPKLGQRIVTDTMARCDMYRQINARFTMEEMKARTIKTAAQYLAMGQFAAANGHIVCNHSTVNLCWYKEAGTAVLHNPVTVY
jgi:hypothetical protein